MTAGFILWKSIFSDHLVFQFEGAERKLVTLIPGDGVGPELVGAVKHVFRLVLLTFYVRLYSVDLEMKLNNRLGFSLTLFKNHFKSKFKSRVLMTI